MVGSLGMPLKVTPKRAKPSGDKTPLKDPAVCVLHILQDSFLASNHRENGDIPSGVYGVDIKGTIPRAQGYHHFPYGTELGQRLPWKTSGDSPWNHEFSRLYCRSLADESIKKIGGETYFRNGSDNSSVVLCRWNLQDTLMRCPETWGYCCWFQWCFRVAIRWDLFWYGEIFITRSQRLFFQRTTSFQIHRSFVGPRLVSPAVFWSRRYLCLEYPFHKSWDPSLELASDTMALSTRSRVPREIRGFDQQKNYIHVTHICPLILSYHETFLFSYTKS